MQRTRLAFGILLGFLFFLQLAGAQDSDKEFTLDITSGTTALPKIFRPSIDLSGRGFHRQESWPQGLAAPEVLDIWQRDIGFGGIYRMQYNLWEISQLHKNKEAQENLLRNYDQTMQKITEAGGIVILDIFGTPAGLGKVLDKKSSPWDLKAFKALIKEHIRTLSCNKRYNIWYEVWSAPDLDDFFLGRQQEYLNLYRSIAECIDELEAETKIHIPLGGPAVSWWFQDVDGNNIVSPEESLIYKLIKFCARYRLPLDFISWHAYSTDPKAEKAATKYNKNPSDLIRDWLSYFKLDRNTLLIVDEWNYDTNANVLPERQEKSFIAASYIPARIKNMHESGIDYQLYFSLEDFQNNKEGVVRNTGVFGFNPEYSEYKGTVKSAYNAFRILASLGSDMFPSALKFGDEFVGAVATKATDSMAILFYNYIDPEITSNYLSRNIAGLNNQERKVLLGLVNSGRIERIWTRELEVSKLRATNRLKGLLKKAQELNTQAAKFKSEARNVKINLQKLKSNYLYQRYVIDSSCSQNCKFVPVEEKEINAPELYQETLSLKPYSVALLILKEKPSEPQGLAAPSATLGQPPENPVSPGAEKTGVGNVTP